MKKFCRTVGAEAKLCACRLDFVGKLADLLAVSPVTGINPCAFFEKAHNKGSITYPYTAHSDFFR